MLPKNVKLRINVNDQLNTDFGMKKNTAFTSVANIIKNLHIHKNMHLLYKQDLFKDKKRKYINFY